MSSSLVELEAPPGRSALPSFEQGWLSHDGSVEPYLCYMLDEHDANWSAALEAMHEESSRSHFIDIHTRRAILAQLDRLQPRAVVVDVGCSSGYLLADLRTAHPDALLVGIDLVGAGLARAHTNVPDARLVQADARSLPLGAASVDAVVSANLLEHVADDRRVLAELHRVLRPGAAAVIVVPAGPSLYDYYDRFLGHQRRYGRGELAGRAREVGLAVVQDIYLGALLYPPFWLIKQRNRRLCGQLPTDALNARVTADIDRTGSSRVGRLACAVEQVLARHSIRLPMGIRELAVLRRPDST